MNTQPKPVFSIVLLVLLICTIAASCNNSAEEKTVPAPDTATQVIPAPTADPLNTDTSKMDTANTKPVKSTNAVPPAK
ncbi:MAG: hypothetical protein ABIU63_03970 [Chitinophagaceae bacterium]